MAGLAWRLAPLGLPRFLYKYGGSALWGAMVYCLAGAALIGSGPRRIVMWSAIVAIASEFLRLYHQPDFDWFRATLAGALLFGRVFSWWNIAAYLVGIAAAAAIYAVLARLRGGIAGRGRSRRSAASRR